MSRVSEMAPVRANWMTTKIDNLKKFYREVKLEMKRVTWPSRQDVINTTVITVIAVFFFAFYLFVIDVALNKGIEELIKVIGK